MQLSLPMKLRIAASAATGVALIGILGWPLATPHDPFGIVSITVGSLNFANGIIFLAPLAVLVGLIAYFLCWPYGREIGILAVPSGLAIWAVRCGSMANLIQLNPTLAQRQELFISIRWEPIFWLIVVAAGFLGVFLGWKMCPKKTGQDKVQEKSHFNLNTYIINAIIALGGSVLIAQFCIAVLAQGIRIFDSKLGSVMSQPSVGQIVFAVLVSFGLAAFIVKKAFDINYTWSIIASGFVTVFVNSVYLRENALQHLIDRYPAVFFINPVMAILPVQMVVFGTLGSIAGYWLAVQYNYWRKHEMIP